MSGDKIQLHHDFWNRKDLKRPLVSFHPGEDFFFSRHYRAAYHLLENGKRISPDMLDVDAFMEDYERIYQTAAGFMQDGFWCAQPYTGIPWMEGILGCDIFATKNSYISRPWVKSLDETDGISFNPENPWFLKYMEFIEKLVKLSDGRFPVGEPIMRGPSDMAGALLGQSEMIFAIVDEPGRMKRLFKKVAEIPIFKRILEKKNLIIWGDLNEADIDVIAGALPPRGIYLNPVVPDADRANALMNHMSKKKGPENGK
jgi:hypothetical protein